MSGLVKNLLVPFLIGGTTIGAVKFAASHMHNPGLAAIFGGIPVGLVSLYFVANSEISSYAISSFYVTMILGVSILAFCILHSYTSLSKNGIVTISLIVWVVLVGGKYFLKHAGSRSLASTSPPFSVSKQ